MFGRSSFRGSVNSRGSVSSLNSGDDDGGYETPAETMDDFPAVGVGSSARRFSTGLSSVPGSPNRSLNGRANGRVTTDQQQQQGRVVTLNMDEMENGDFAAQNNDDDNNAIVDGTNEDPNGLLLQEPPLQVVQLQEPEAGEILTPDKVDKILRFNKLRSKFRRPELGSSLPARIFKSYPRMYSCVVGIIVPVWALVCISLLFGLALGNLEFEGEINANDDAMRNAAYNAAFRENSEQLIGSLSSACFILYQNTTSIDDIGPAFDTILHDYDTFGHYVEELESSIVQGNSLVNLTDFNRFVNACGDAGTLYQNFLREQYFDTNDTDASAGDTSVSFNWVRCVNRTDVNAYNRIFTPNARDLNASRPEAQAQFYEDAWTENQQMLEEQYFDEFMTNNTTSLSSRRYGAFIQTNGYETDRNITSRAQARFEAFLRSAGEATAGDRCGVNVAATAWFWFTIMTTVGYGNQAPTSEWGRTLTAVLGFFSIIFFATVLANAGHITAYVVNDFFHRIKLGCLSKSGVMVAIWGGLWIAWLVYLGFLFRNWEYYRLGVPVDDLLSMQDGIWWAFISTTTIGLGDYYPSPEVLFISDLLAYSLAFLFGFILLSSFLTEFSLLVTKNVPDMSVELGKRLKYVGMTKYPEMLGGVRDSIEDYPDSTHLNAEQPLESSSN